MFTDCVWMHDSEAYTVLHRVVFSQNYSFSSIVGFGIFTVFVKRCSYIKSNVSPSTCLWHEQNLLEIWGSVCVTLFTQHRWCKDVVSVFYNRKYILIGF